MRTAAPTHTDLAPALLDAAALERVRTQLVRRLSVVQAAIDRLGALEEADAEGLLGCTRAGAGAGEQA